MAKKAIHPFNQKTAVELKKEMQDFNFNDIIFSK
jgi:hypothetical protein